MSNFKFIKFEMDGNTAVISINRPEVYNALTLDAKFEIIEAIKLSNNDPSIRSIILTGEGKAFCTGQDLNDRTIQGDKGPVDLGLTLETEWNPLINSLRNSNKIIIGAINGVCAGAGVSIALACDLLVSKPKVKFVSGFAKLGLAPDAGSTFAMTNSLGPKKTLEFFLLGEGLLSDDLKEANLINFLDENPVDFSKTLAQKINHLAPNSVSMIKSNILFSLEATYKESMQKEICTQRFLGNTKDYQEGLAAFFEKRLANFKGV
jgi:2-(1,2-epoxy-1,2-dihydrophenyl)acetyl-CoA isomerase